MLYFLAKFYTKIHSFLLGWRNRIFSLTDQMWPYPSLNIRFCNECHEINSVNVYWPRLHLRTHLHLPNTEFTIDLIEYCLFKIKKAQMQTSLLFTQKHFNNHNVKRCRNVLFVLLWPQFSKVQWGKSLLRYCVLMSTYLKIYIIVDFVLILHHR